MYIRWEKKYETGHPMIDAEHRLLVMLFRKLDIAIKTRQLEATLARTVLEVKKFVEFHFISEENLMLESAYPEAEAHRMRHLELSLELVARVDRLYAHSEFPDELLDFLYAWLTEHIAHEDQQVAVHLLASAQRPVAEMIYAEYLGAAAPRLATGAPASGRSSAINLPPGAPPNPPQKAA